MAPATEALKKQEWHHMPALSMAAGVPQQLECG
jgi:hypothetical protein